MSNNLYNNIQLTETTIKKRQAIKQSQDEFMTFSWDGYDAFDSFGMFIINEKKGSLKFYNGPGFSNEYTKPQYDPAGGILTGVTFNKQSISFSVGVYWISIEHYRQMINWLNPQKTSYIIFGHDRRYRYNVKLSKLGDSTRFIVGKERIGDEFKPMYYTELSLTFEVQGDACAKGVNSYEFRGESSWKTGKMYYSINNNAKQGDVDCDQKSYTTQPGQVISFDGSSSIVRLVSNRYYDSTNHIVYGDGNCSSGLTYRYNPQKNNEIITFQKELSKKEPQYYCINENINNCHSLWEGGNNMLFPKYNTETSQLSWEKPEANSRFYLYSLQWTTSAEKIVFYMPEEAPWTPLLLKPKTAGGDVGPNDIREGKYDNTFITTLSSANYSNEVLTNNAGFKYRRIILSFSANEARDSGYRLFIPAPYSMCKKIGNSYVLTEDYPTTDNLPGHNNDYVWGTESGFLSTWKVNLHDDNKAALWIANENKVWKGGSGVGATVANFYYDYPVKKGEVYKLSCYETNGFIPYFLLASDKETIIEHGGNGNGKVERIIKVTQDGYLRLQINKKTNERYKQHLRLSKLIWFGGWKITSTSGGKVCQTILSKNNDFILSDLPTPFEVTIPLNICQSQDDNTKEPEYTIALKAKSGDVSLDLFTIVLHNLTHGDPAVIDECPKLTLTYVSQTGLLYLKQGPSNIEPLSLLTLNDTGDRIVKTYNIYSAKLPGAFDYSEFYDDEISLELTINKKDNNVSGVTNPTIPTQFTEDLEASCNIVCYPRTNLI